MKSFGAKPLMYTQPVYMIATYNDDGTPDVMNAAWGGISGENKVTICVDKGHRTTENFLSRKAFTLSPGIEKYVAECDYLGLVSGYDVPDKVSKAGFHTEKSSKVDAPIIKEIPMVLECRVVSYDEVTEVLVGEIVDVLADESILTDGNIDTDKLKPISYDPCMHRYYALDRNVGEAFSIGKSI